MKEKLQSLLFCRKRNLLLNVNSWRRSFLTLLLFCCSIFLGLAGVVDPAQSSHYNVTWDKQKGRYVIEIRVYDFEGRDNWASRYQINVVKDGAEERLCIVDTYLHSGDGDQNVTVRVKNTMPVSHGKVWVDDNSGYKNIPFMTTSYSSTENINSSNGYYNCSIKPNGWVNHIFVYWYPSSSKYVGQNLSFRLEGKTTRSDNYTWNKNVTYGPVNSEHYVYKAKITSQGLDYNTGIFKFNVSVDNVDKYSYTNSQLDIETSIDGVNWIKRETRNFNHTYYSQDINNIKYTQYKYYNSSTNYVKLTNQEWANGVFIRAVAKTNPDGKVDGTGSCSYVQTSTSDPIRTNSNAVMNSFSVSQNNRNINFAWTTINPTQNSTTQNTGKFIIERLRNNEWEKLKECSYSSTTTSYNTTYEMPDNECNTGAFTDVFRIRRDVFNNDNLWQDYMNRSYSLKYYTDYKTLNITTITRNLSESTATLTWSFNENVGLWDNNVKVKVYQNSALLNIDPIYSGNSVTIPSLQGCTKYNFQIETSVLGKSSISEPISFIMPNLQEREISTFEASKGYYNNSVLLSWTVPEDKSDFDYFAVTRVPIDGGETVTIDQITHSGLTKYSLLDQTMDVGTIYKYQIIGYSKCFDNYSNGDMKEDEGFCQPYGIISGRIAYNGSQGVAGVSVFVEGNDEKTKNNSIYFSAVDNSSYIKVPGDVIDFKNNKNFSFQTWLYPGTQSVDKPFLLTKANILDLMLKKISDKENSLGIYFGGQTVLLTDKNVSIPSDTWTHLTCNVSFISSESKILYQIYINGEFKAEGNISNINSEHITNHMSMADDLIKSDSVFIASRGRMDWGYIGYMDEIRFWKTCLDEKTIRSNYDAFLSGKDKDLLAYYRCDEPGVYKLFDLSGSGNVFNKRNGSMARLVIHSDFAPPTNLLSNKTITDEDGNYLINTIPYTTDGLQYNIIPSLGVHSFNPSKRPVFVSPSSTTFNNFDYSDESSFPVSGNIYYAGTNYPVEGVNFYIDGVICSKNGEVVASASDGSYTIEVPIGDHFIQAKKNGHVFANEGRLPADANNIKLQTFNQPISNVYFYDNTTVTVAGRIVGGNIEDEKPLGLGISKNNIGKVKVLLSAGDNIKLNATHNLDDNRFENSKDVKNLVNPSLDINSEAYINGGSDDNVRRIIIETDSLTGEFAVKLPPLEYVVESLTIIGNNKALETKLISKIDASNPLVVNVDSIEIEEGKYKKFDYCAAMKLKYQNTPVFTVTDKSNGYGAFGEAFLKYQDVTMTKAVDVPVYTFEKNNLTYNIKVGTKAYPIYVQDNKYRFELKAYEEYINADNGKSFTVPLKGNTVTIANGLSASQCVYVESGTTDEGTEVVAGNLVELKENQLTLDSLGTAIYEWQAGLPNITPPYSRSIEIICSHNGAQIKWENAYRDGILVGALPSGNNFVTSGPDQVQMILRDPPGTSSYSFWEKGVTFTTETITSDAFVTNEEASVATSLGYYGTTVVGTPGFGVINEVGQKHTLTAGAEFNLSTTSADSYSTTITTTQRISTSDEFDFVGESGDLFIGSATNIIFGNCRQVALKKISDNEYTLENKDAMTTGVEFGTSFKYTTNYIENTLIPNLYKLRNNLLKTVSSVTEYNSLNFSDTVTYITLLKETDEGYGSRNFDALVWKERANTKKNLTSGPSYKMLTPKNMTDTIYQDKVLWYNEQIKTWEQVLADNEKAKYDAINDFDSYHEINHSFDAGAVIEASATNCIKNVNTTELDIEVLAVIGYETGFEVNKTGVSVSAKARNGWKGNTTTSEGTETCVTTGYVFKEEGTDDALTVDVYRAPDGHGAIFRTRGGQTTCPYEGEVVTKYYKPGFVISEATMQIEIPVITVVDRFAVDVPSGKSANYTLKLENTSETDGDVWFDLAMLDETNPDGAQITIDGAKLTDGRSILVRAGETLLKTLQISQSKQDVMDYEDIRVVLKSQCQADPTAVNAVIADTVSLYAYFVPSSSDITLQIANRIMNQETSDSLSLLIKDYDRNFKNLKAIRLQYKGERDVDWKLAKEYIPYKIKGDGRDTITSGGQMVYKLGMGNNILFPDQTYTFRAVTATMYGDKEITTESEHISVIKDMATPMVMGKPSPTNGIYTEDNEISVTFNEAIKSSSLSKDNFIVKARLNGYEIDHEVALKLQGEAVYTDADIDFSGRSFCFETWMNISSAGEILSHGNGSDKFVVSINKNGKLIVTINGKEYVSTNVIPFDKWVFLYVAYDIDSNKLSANIAYDSYDKVMFNKIDVIAYNGRGRLRVGSGMSGAMHSLSLWNKIRSYAEAKSEKMIAKKSSVPNLIGYWKMEEGRGMTVKDYARSRHMTIPVANSWHIEADNYAVELNGTQYVGIDSSLYPVSQEEDFVIEMWFKTPKVNSVATLFNVNDATLSLQLDSEGKAEIVIEGSIFSTVNTSYADNVWHNIVLNVQRNGNAILYIDDVAIKQMSGSLIPAVASNQITLGARRFINATTQKYVYTDYLTGIIDEFRFRKARITSAVISENTYNRLAGDEAGLLAYYPFETKQRNANNIIETVPSFMNKVDSVFAVYSKDVITVKDAPSLKDYSELTNVRYSFVASDNKIVLNIDETDDKIEGCNLYIAVSGVRDANNNPANPISWNAYVNINALKWNQESTAIVTESLKEKSFDVTISNNGSDIEAWSLSNVPSWLSVSETSGSLKPLYEKVLTFTVNSFASIGKYEETMYLTGNKNISEPFVVALNVTGERPDWAINPTDYEYSMNMIAQLKIVDVISQDEDDLIAAFIGEECIGLASPEYYNRYDSYYTLMDIYGNSSMLNSNVNFKVWDASTGNIYPLTKTSQTVTFADNALAGSFETPVEVNASDMIEQRIALKKGWNWTSIIVEDKDDMSINSMMGNIVNSSIIIKDKSTFSVPADGQWTGLLTTVAPGQMYKVKMSQTDNLTPIGKQVVPAEVVITVKSGWNWLGFTPSQNMSLNDALGALNPTTGDIVKGQTGFSTYNGYEWIGSLKSMSAGNGYLYNSNNSKDTKFAYPNKVAMYSRKLNVGQNVSSLESDIFEVVADNKYPGNMTILGMVYDDDQVIKDVEVATFINDECRGAIKTDDSGLVFLTVAGGDGKSGNVIFKVSHNDKIMTINQNLTYEDDAMFGSFDNPYIINLAATGLDNLISGISVYPTRTNDFVNVKINDVMIRSIDVFDISGVKLTEFKDVNSSFKIDFNNYEEGIYFIDITMSDGRNTVYKIVKY